MVALKPERVVVKKEVSRTDIVFAVARHAATGRLFCGGSDATVYEIDVDSPKPEPRILGKHDSYVTGLALAGSTLVSGSYDGRLIWWNIDSRSQVRTVDAHRKWIRGVVATPDGKAVVSVGDDMVCRVWDVDSSRLLHELRGHEELTPTHFPSMLFACAISADGGMIATGDKVGHVVVWATQTGEKLAAFDAPAMYTWDQVQRLHSIGGIRSLAFSPDGKSLAVGGSGKILNIDHLDGKALVEIYDWSTGQRTQEFPSDKFKGLVEYLSFYPTGGWLLAAGGGDKDGFIVFIDPAGKKILGQEKVAMYIHDISPADLGATLYAVGHRKVAVLDVA